MTTRGSTSDNRRPLALFRMNRVVSHFAVSTKLTSPPQPLSSERHDNVQHNLDHTPNREKQ